MKTALAGLRAAPGANTERDAGPELTPIKHLLRAWVEQRLPVNTPWPPTTEAPAALPGPSDLAALSARLNQALADAGLTCASAPSPRRCMRDDDEDARGYLGVVSIGSLDFGRYLFVTTEVGVRCRTDPMLWQVALRGDRFMLVRWLAPYRFTLVRVSPAPTAVCDQADAMPDNIGTFFATPDS